MDEKTYSQKVARVFEIVDYFMLLPAAFGVFAGFFLVGINPLLTLFLYVFVSAGVVLLVGYIKHSRGRLAEKYVPALWLTTAGYNFLLSLPCLFWISWLLQTGTFRDFKGDLDEGGILLFLVLLGTVFGYLSAIVLSLKAFSFERRKKFI